LLLVPKKPICSARLRFVFSYTTYASQL